MIEQNKDMTSDNETLTQPIPFIPSYFPKTLMQQKYRFFKVPKNLPTEWNKDDSLEHIKVLNNGLRIEYIGPGVNIWRDAAAIRANHPIPSEVGFYYFEVNIIDKGSRGNIGVGLTKKNVPLNQMPGWVPISYGYHGDDGLAFKKGQGSEYGPLYSAGDTIGCGINYYDRTIFFTKNGINLGIAFNNVSNKELYPVIGLISKGECVEANFGAMPFKFDITFYSKEILLWETSIGNI
ncbi:14315_t:CDS:2 [Acaulospora morrowiae]|uniref:14315_t:CDS:1 n=1 Tax=Acaulospora morrowiae TaxID=94023 RepID=A0A9N8YV79_9GLOM|nr:14315_t:CDS:2 [Acaulospora morrowiae]